MSEPTFGISIARIDNEPRPAVWSDMSVVGIVGTAPAANAETFPLNTPVFMYSDDAAMLTALGATGTLGDAITGINAQLGDFQVAAKCILVRVTEGLDATATMTNIIGDAAAKSGLRIRERLLPQALTQERISFEAVIRPEPVRAQRQKVPQLLVPACFEQAGQANLAANDMIVALTVGPGLAHPPKEHVSVVIDEGRIAGNLAPAFRNGVEVINTILLNRLEQALQPFGPCVLARRSGDEHWNDLLQRLVDGVTQCAR